MTTDNKVEQALDELIKSDNNFRYLLEYPLTNVVLYHKFNGTSAQSCLDLTAYSDVVEDGAKLGSHDHMSDLLNNSSKDDIKNYITVFYFATVLLQVLVNKIISTKKVFTSASSGRSGTATHTNGGYIATRFGDLYTSGALPPLSLSLYDVNNTNEESSGGSLVFNIYLIYNAPTSNYMDWPIAGSVDKNGHRKIYMSIHKLSELNYTNIQKIIDDIG